MPIQAMPPFFIVKINKHNQKEKREKQGALYLSPDHVHMQHEIQYGEIVSIGVLAKKEFPEANVGDILLFHHFITGKEVEDKWNNPYLIDEDETYKYYWVTCYWFEGERPLAYGVWNGKELIPHKEYIFLKTTKTERKGFREIPESQLKVTAGGLLVFEKWEETRAEKGERMAELKRQIESLTKSNASDDLKRGIEAKELEANKISKQINKKEYLVYDVAHVNPETKKQFSKDFDKVGMLNIACNTRFDFNEQEYIVAQTNYLSFVEYAD